MEALRLKSLHLIQDGALAMVIDQKLAEINQDCVERATLEKPRTLTIQIAIQPSGDDPLQAASVAFNVKSSLPGSSVRQHMKYLRRNKVFGFEPDTTSVEYLEGQRALDFEGEGSEEE